MPWESLGISAATRYRPWLKNGKLCACSLETKESGADFAQRWSAHQLSDVQCQSGWWFQTCFIFHNIWDNPSHWLILFKMVKNHQPAMLWQRSCWTFLDTWWNMILRVFFECSRRNSGTEQKWIALGTHWNSGRHKVSKLMMYWRPLAESFFEQRIFLSNYIYNYYIYIYYIYIYIIYYIYIFSLQPQLLIQGYGMQHSNMPSSRGGNVGSFQGVKRLLSRGFLSHSQNLKNALW